MNSALTKNNFSANQTNFNFTAVPVTISGQSLWTSIFVLLNNFYEYNILEIILQV